MLEASRQWESSWDIFQTDIFWHWDRNFHLTEHHAGDSSPHHNSKLRPKHLLFGSISAVPATSALLQPFPEICRRKFQNCQFQGHLSPRFFRCNCIRNTSTLVLNTTYCQLISNDIYARCLDRYRKYLKSTSTGTALTFQAGKNLLTSSLKEIFLEYKRF